MHRYLPFFLAYGLLGCHSASQAPSDTKAVLIQTDPKDGGYLIKLPRSHVGDLFQLQSFEPSSQYRANPGNDLDDNYPRADFPLMETELTPKKNMSLEIYRCPEAYLGEDCQSFGEIWRPNGNEADSETIYSAFLESLQLLTLNDRVNACYLDSLKKTDQFEEQDGDFFSNAREYARSCDDPNSQSCINSKESEEALGYLRSEELSEEEKQEFEKQYRNREKLGRRLGYFPEAHLRDNDQKIGDLLSFSLYRLEDQERTALDHANISRKACMSVRSLPGRAMDCFLGQPLLRFLSEGLLLHKLGSPLNSSDLPTQPWETPGRSMELREKYRGLFAAAIELMEATNLEPKKTIAEFERREQLTISCDTVADYQFGDRTPRYDYAIGKAAAKATPASSGTSREVQELETRLHPAPRQNSAISFISGATGIRLRDGVVLNISQMKSEVCQVDPSRCEITFSFDGNRLGERYQELRVVYNRGPRQKIIAIDGFSPHSVIQTMKDHGIRGRLGRLDVEVQGLVKGSNGQTWERIQSNTLRFKRRQVYHDVKMVPGGDILAPESGAISQIHLREGERPAAIEPIVFKEELTPRFQGNHLCGLELNRNSKNQVVLSGRLYDSACNLALSVEDGQEREWQAVLSLISLEAPTIATTAEPETLTYPISVISEQALAEQGREAPFSLAAIPSEAAVEKGPQSAPGCGIERRGSSLVIKYTGPALAFNQQIISCSAVSEGTTVAELMITRDPRSAFRSERLN